MENIQAEGLAQVFLQYKKHREELKTLQERMDVAYDILDEIAPPSDYSLTNLLLSDDDRDKLEQILQVSGIVG